MTQMKRPALAALLATLMAGTVLAEPARRQFSFYHQSGTDDQSARAVKDFAAHALDRLMLTRQDLQVRVFASSMPAPQFHEAVAVRNRSLALIDVSATPEAGGFRIRNRLYLGSLQGRLQFSPVVVEIVYSTQTYGTTQDVFIAVAEYAMAVEERRLLVDAGIPLTVSNTLSIRNKLNTALYAVTTAERRERSAADQNLLRYLRDLHNALTQLLEDLPS